MEEGSLNSLSQLLHYNFVPHNVAYSLTYIMYTGVLECNGGDNNLITAVSL